MWYTIHMKIYSLQEENDRLKAKRGLPTMGSQRDPFEVRHMDRTMTTSGTQRPARAGKRQMAMPQQRPATQMPQQARPQTRRVVRRKRAGIGWMIWLIFIIAISGISSLAESCSLF